MRTSLHRRSFIGGTVATGLGCIAAGLTTSSALSDAGGPDEGLYVLDESQAKLKLVQVVFRWATMAHYLKFEEHQSSGLYTVYLDLRDDSGGNLLLCIWLLNSTLDGAHLYAHASHALPLTRHGARTPLTKKEELWKNEPEWKVCGPPPFKACARRITTDNP